MKPKLKLDDSSHLYSAKSAINMDQIAKQTEYTKVH